MNPTLIKANIALFNGSRAEARRLLAAYQAQVGATPPPEETTLVQWLNAQAQDDREARVTGLRQLLATAPPNDPYARLAAQYLADEQKAEAAAASDTVPEPGEASQPKARGILGVVWWKAAAFVLVGVVAGVIVMTVFGGGASAGAGGTQVAQIPTTAPGSTPAGTPLPDRSTPIPGELHQTTYPDGILQVTRIEDGSGRILDQQNNVAVPVSGTRFVALKLLFECRGGSGGICRNPPEANVALVLDDLVTQAPRLSDVSVAGERGFEQVSQGNTTDGWVVFEVPDTLNPASLAVLVTRPEATPEGSQQQQPQFIPLFTDQAEATESP
ncbi:MAG: hypothetical protein JNL34_05265 [Anaerolineae bacterium]|nr:hypothetical protein [Anaerolineae bacterium]